MNVNRVSFGVGFIAFFFLFGSIVGGLFLTVLCRWKGAGVSLRLAARIMARVFGDGRTQAPFSPSFIIALIPKTRLNLH